MVRLCVLRRSIFMGSEDQKANFTPDRGADPSPATQEKFRAIARYDTPLYARALQLFDARARACLPAAP
jgi:hypothetical protein